MPGANETNSALTQVGDICLRLPPHEPRTRPGPIATTPAGRAYCGVLILNITCNTRLVKGQKTNLSMFCRTPHTRPMRPWLLPQSHPHEG